MAARAHADEGLEKKRWGMDDALRGSMGAGEYRSVVLSLLFLEYVSDAFEVGLMGESPRLTTDQRWPAAWRPVRGSHLVG